MRVGWALICKLVRTTSSHDRPWQIALAITAGVLLGIVPKISLMFVAVGFICFILPAHLPILVLTALTVSLATPLLESTFGRLGLWSLTHPQMTAVWNRLDQMPLLPWLGIHNTVVNGGLLFWLLASVPLFVTSLIFSRIAISEMVSEEVAAILLTADESLKTSNQDDSQEVRPVMGAIAAGPSSPSVTSPIVVWDDIQRPATSRTAIALRDYERDFEREAASLNADEVAARAADMAAWAEELITDELLNDSRTSQPTDSGKSLTDINTSSENIDQHEQWLIETTMEVVRMAELAVANQAVMKSKPSGEGLNAGSPDSPLQENSEIQTGNTTQAANMDFQATISHSSNSMSPGSRKTTSSIRHDPLPHSSHRTHLDATRPEIAVNVGNSSDRPREVALHYLLRHLKDVQEKAQKQ